MHVAGNHRRFGDEGDSKNALNSGGRCRYVFSGVAAPRRCPSGEENSSLRDPGDSEEAVDGVEGEDVVVVGSTTDDRRGCFPFFLLLFCTGVVGADDDIFFTMAMARVR